MVVIAVECQVMSSHSLTTASWCDRQTKVVVETTPPILTAHDRKCSPSICILINNTTPESPLPIRQSYSHSRAPMTTTKFRTLETTGIANWRWCTTPYTKLQAKSAHSKGQSCSYGKIDTHTPPYDRNFCLVNFRRKVTKDGKPIFPRRQNIIYCQSWLFRDNARHAYTAFC